MKLKIPSLFPSSEKTKEKGMTLIEIIIVITLIGGLFAILVTNVMDQADSAKEDQVGIQFGTITQSLQLYRLHNGKYPTTEQGMDALLEKPADAKRWRGPYIEKAKLQDPWGNPIEYESNGGSFKLTSPGKNGQLGDDDDIFYPEEEKSEASE